MINEKIKNLKGQTYITCKICYPTEINKTLEIDLIQGKDNKYCSEQMICLDLDQILQLRDFLNKITKKIDKNG